MGTALGDRMSGEGGQEATLHHPDGHLRLSPPGRRREGSWARSTKTSDGASPNPCVSEILSSAVLNRSSETRAI